MYEARNAEYIQIYESIVAMFFLLFERHTRVPADTGRQPMLGYSWITVCGDGYVSVGMGAKATMLYFSV